MVSGTFLHSQEYKLAANPVIQGDLHGRCLIRTPAAVALFPTFPALVWGRTLTMDGIVTIFPLGKGQIIDPAQTRPLFITLVA